MAAAFHKASAGLANKEPTRKISQNKGHLHRRAQSALLDRGFDPPEGPCASCKMPRFLAGALASFFLPPLTGNLGRPWGVLTDYSWGPAPRYRQSPQFQNQIRRDAENLGGLACPPPYCSPNHTRFAFPGLTRKQPPGVAQRSNFRNSTSTAHPPSPGLRFTILDCPLYDSQSISAACTSRFGCDLGQVSRKACTIRRLLLQTAVARNGDELRRSCQ